MVNDLKTKENINTGESKSYTDIELTPADIQKAQRVISYMASGHFQELFRDAFIATKPFIEEVDLVDSASEYNFEFPIGTKQFEVIPQGQNRITYSYNENGTATINSIENDRFDPFEGNFLNLESATKLYMKADTNNTKVKVLYWT